MASRAHLVECPYCRATMEVEAASGRVLNKWEKRNKSLPTEEKFKEALDQEKHGKDKLSQYFQGAQSQMEQNKKKAEELFKENLKKIKKSD